jgi:CBS domain-containing protein
MTSLEIDFILHFRKYGVTVIQNARNDVLMQPVRVGKHPTLQRLHSPFLDVPRPVALHRASNEFGVSHHPHQAEDAMPTAAATSVNLTAGDVMTTKVLAVPTDMPVEELAEFLVNHNISGAPVVDEDEALVGVVSLTDLARHEGIPLRRKPANGRHDFYLRHEIDSLTDAGIEDVTSFRVDSASGVTVTDIMTPTIFNVLENTPVQTVADYMLRGRIHRQFVTRGNRVVGVITAMDLLKIVRDLPEEA